MVDIDDNPYFKMFQFPGGEWGVKWTELNEEDEFNFDLFHVDLLARINSGNDLLKLLTFANACKNKNVYLNVTIPYFPGARQDRVSNIGEPLTVKVYADLINSLGFERVTIVDPHSDVTPALLNDCNVVPVADILKKIVVEHDYDTILIPDAGAAKKTFSYYFPDLEFNKKLTFVQCLKKRDTNTGKLSGFRITDEIPSGANILICDDVIDGGGTFVGLAEELGRTIKNQTEYLGWEILSFKLGLYGTHGIFSKGVNHLLHSADNLDAPFDQVFTTDSIRKDQPEGVKVFELFHLTNE
jgi:ribose-phosphate pyrophosphokinase